MDIPRYLCQIMLLLKRRLLRLTIYKLLCGVLSSAVIVYILVIIWMEKPEIVPLQLPQNVENITRKFIAQTKYPPIIWWNSGYRLTDETILCPDDIRCDAFGANHMLRPNSYGAYIFYGSRLNFDDLPLPRRPQKVIWALSHEESPKNVVELLHEPGLNLFNYSSTFSRKSDVPFPLQYMLSLGAITSRHHFVSTPKKNDFLKEISPIIFTSSNCHFTFTDRDNYVKELMKYIPIDSYGKCLNNKKWPEDFPEDHLNNLHDTTLNNFIARYKFMIAIENGVCEDYITEKFWRPITLGVVPIYFGSPSIKDWCPNNKSAIFVRDYATPKQLGEYLYKLISNDTLYEEYLEHKTKGLLSNQRLINEMIARPYQTDVLETNSVFECFVCKKLHENIRQPKVNIVTKSHYNCSQPISALTLEPMEEELPWWEYSKANAKKVYKRVRTAS